MPLKMKTRCSFPGCPQTTRGRFCATHQSEAWKRPQRRGTPAQRGYDATWAKVADQRRNLDYYLCQPCLARGRLTTSKTVDHIIPVHVRPDLRLVIENTQVICPTCHHYKTAADTKKYGSSTAPWLTEEQQEQRRLAQLEQPPRAGEL